MSLQTAPEYAIECAECGEFLDLYDDNFALDNGKHVCRGCRTMCLGSCGNWLSDPEGAIILRCVATGRREPWCPDCAAEEWLERLISFASDNDYFQPWPMPGFPNHKRLPWAKELGADQIARLYSFYVSEGGVA